MSVIMAVTTPTKTIAALKALKALQEDAKRKGLDKLSMDQIDAEVAACRREKRVKPLTGMRRSRPSRLPCERQPQALP